MIFETVVGKRQTGKTTRALQEAQLRGGAAVFVVYSGTLARYIPTILGEAPTFVVTYPTAIGTLRGFSHDVMYVDNYDFLKPRHLLDALEYAVMTGCVRVVLIQGREPGEGE